ncbi:MAG: primosomal protein N' [Aliarcobacter sp.]|nr:primosomal protein N' [Aliarcobacter sp.]
MYYYELALLKSPLNNLTFQSEEKIILGKKVLIKLKQRKNLDEAVVIKEVEKPIFKCSDIVENTNEYFDEKMQQIASFVSQYYVCSLGEALSVYIPFDENINPIFNEEKFDSKIVLSAQQEKAKEFLKDKKQALLFADTGAGKTEVYIKIIEEHLNANKQAILLMPEISLTPQMQKRLEKVFGKSIAIWHSKITKKKKEEILRGLQEGSIRLIAGARSALFLPYSNLGVIVVDEEHDDSYKSDSKPRFHTKDLSIYMAKKFDLQLVLGSATVSSSSFFKIPFFRLDETYHQTKKYYSFEDSEANLSLKVIDKITKTIDSGNQVIVFLPTRANFKYQICTTCGKSVECPYCSVSMSLHKNDLALKCHYCGYTQQIPDTCPSCHNGIIKNLRVGTAQIEEELKEIFPTKIIKRFDRDQIKTNNQLKTILNEFNKGEIDILVGTQMLSKGHDYHNVRLAVVLGIDSILNMNSYKAREKALSLLIQISGRSGRKGEGEVIIQTKNEGFFNHYLNESNYKEFLESELEFRQELYPPFLKMAKVTFSHANGIKIKDEMDYFVKLLKDNKNIEVVGFGQSPIFKMANKYRYEILLRSSNIKALLNALHSIQSPNASIDMDTIY